MLCKHSRRLQQEDAIKRRAFLTTAASVAVATPLVAFAQAQPAFADIAGKNWKGNFHGVHVSLTFSPTGQVYANGGQDTMKSQAKRKGDEISFDSAEGSAKLKVQGDKLVGTMSFGTLKSDITFTQ